jgi:hypothetical protein
MRWPAHGTATRLAAKHATKIRKAFKSALDGEEIAASFAQTHPAGGSVSPSLARDWAQIHINAAKKPLIEALTPLYADGYVLGETAATYVYAHLIGFKKSPTAQEMARASVVDWQTWTPGNKAAAALLKPKNGLQSLLDSRALTIDGILSTKLDRIGTILSQALEVGVAPSQVSILVDQVINDPERAMVIAQTEMSRAVSVASRELYQDSNVEQVEWLVAEGCADCQENADASPIGIDEEFPSGDTEPPAHPNCMCSLAPYIVSDNTDNIDLSVRPDLVKFVPSKLEVKRALSRLKILPNPPDNVENIDIDKLVEAPWQSIEPITVDPNIWDRAELALVNFPDLIATDSWLRRKKLKAHIEAMGQAVTSYRAFGLVVQRGEQQIIIDGHHRLTAMWLLGMQQAPVWLVKE